jgi:DNA-binding transcriptional ArsR family regulator
MENTKPDTSHNLEQLREDIERMHGQICYALREPVRILMLFVIGEEGRYVNEISELLDIPQSTASRHLAILRERGLVETERQGTSIKYRLTNAHILTLLDEMRRMVTHGNS